jgi:hypothetical protein
LHVDHIAEEIGGEIPIGGVIILPMILGGDIIRCIPIKEPYI